MSFPRYPKYKPSGVEWLGEVPEGWGVAPLKTAASHNDDTIDEKTDPDTEILYVDISGVDALDGIKTKEPMLFGAAPSRARRRVKHGDTIVSTVRTYLRAIAQVRNPEENLIVSTGFAVVRPRALLSPDYVGYVLSAGYFIEQVIARSSGVSYPAINASDLVRIPVALPPLVEQTAIAEFLDRETGKIDGLVAQQRRLMELLKEKRQAVISHAATKGLNPHAPMKPSGIEWLGDVPAGWEVKRSDSFLTYSRDQLDPKDFQGLQVFHYSIPVVQETGTGQIEDGAEIASGKQIVKKKVVLVSKLNPRKGTICIAEPQQALTLCSTEFVALEPNGCDIRYLSYLVRTEGFRQGLESKVTSVTNSHQRANPVDIYRFWNAWPVLPDQTAIAEFLDSELAKFDTLTAEAQRAIDLLQERCTALISAAVTGQIDARQQN